MAREHHRDGDVDELAKQLVQGAWPVVDGGLLVVGAGKNSARALQIVLGLQQRARAVPRLFPCATSRERQHAGV